MKLLVLFIINLLFSNFLFVDEEVNVYTSRHYDSDTKLYEDFTEETGIKVNIISAKGKALIERLKSEGKSSPADVFITVDAGNLWKVQDYELFTSINSRKIENIVPKKYRGRNNEWIALAKRARVIFFNKEKYSYEDLRNLNYEDLSSETWRNKLAIRSSNNLYNQSLVASLIKNNGKKATAAWAEGVVSNMARTPKGNDRAQIMAVAAGEADIAVANTYYLALMLSGKKGAEQQEAAKKVKAFFPNQNDRGTHMNVSCAALVKGAPNKANAVKLVEFLLTPESQEHFTNNTFEFPMIDGVSPSPLVVNNLGLDFKQDMKTKLASYGKNQAAAVEVMTAAGWK